MYWWRLYKVRRYDYLPLIGDNNGPRAKTVFILTREGGPLILYLQRIETGILREVNHFKGVLPFSKAINMTVVGFMGRL
jgi:hypothetical protein